MERKSFLSILIIAVFFSIYFLFIKSEKTLAPIEIELDNSTQNKKELLEGKLSNSIKITEPKKEIDQSLILTINTSSNHIETPEEVHGLYFTSLFFNQKYFLDFVRNMKTSNKINTLIIDVKDLDGFVAYDSKVKEVIDYKTKKNIIKDIKKKIEDLHKEGFYLIARINVFNDQAVAQSRPELTLKSNSGEPWKTDKGAFWLNPDSEKVWIYNTNLGIEAYNLGFDEINFDYIRFPSEGNMEDLNLGEITGYSSTIQRFSSFLRNQFKNIKISADIFAYSLIEKNNLGIGQKYEDFFPYFDYICPMMYPSHYNKNFLGFENSALHPYEVVRYSLIIGKNRALDFFKNNPDKNLSFKMRPWFQSFSLGDYYDKNMIQSQITALNDEVSINKDFWNGWLLWDASNIYSNFSALK
ncbi:MAG: hypothetical protein EXS49_00175 [Candidatus Pacebacteria bacterium]|nr:hypothetical protein [Candidatus Paceibacterota bacterium]